MTLIGATQVAQVSAGPDQVHLRILATTDLHAHLLPFDYFTDRRTSGIGLARLADLIVQARTSAPNVLLFDNGDTLQGTPLADTVLTEILPNGGTNPMVSAMNGLGFDAGTLGNHDFDFGLEYLQASLASAHFKLALANVHGPDGETFLPPRQMLYRQVIDGSGRMHDLRVGVTGAVPPQVAAWSKPSVEGKLSFSDMTSSVAAQVAALRDEGANLVVVLAHTGLGEPDAPGGAENAAMQIANLPGVDAVVAGHTHELVARSGNADQAPIVQPAAYGTNLGLIDLLLVPSNGKGWDVRSAQAATPATPVRARGNTSNLRRLLNSFPHLRQEVARAHRTTRAHVDSPLGQSAVALETLFSTIAPCAATQLVADAQRAAAAPLLAAIPEISHLPVLSAAAPFRAGGRAGPENYTDIPRGLLKLRHAADLYIYPNALCVLRITGAGLRRWLERSASIYRTIDPTDSTPQFLINHSFAPYNFDRITGVRYEIDISQPPRTDAEGRKVDPSACRVGDLRYSDGRPVHPSDEMLIITNSYRAAGGGHMPSAAEAETLLASSLSVRDAVAQYIAQADHVLAPEVEPSFSFASLGGVEVIYETGLAARMHGARVKQLNLRPSAAEPSAQGFATFQLML